MIINKFCSILAYFNLNIILLMKLFVQSKSISMSGCIGNTQIKGLCPKTSVKFS